MHFDQSSCTSDRKSTQHSLVSMLHVNRNVTCIMRFVCKVHGSLTPIVGHFYGFVQGVTNTNFRLPLQFCV